MIYLPENIGGWIRGYPKSWGQERAKIQVERNASTLAISPDEKFIAVGAAKNIYLYDVATQERVEVLKRHTKEVRAVRFAPKVMNRQDVGYVLVSEGEGVEGAEESEESKDSDDSGSGDSKTLFQWELGSTGRLVLREKPVDIDALTTKALQLLESELTGEHGWNPAEKAMAIIHDDVKLALRDAVHLHERDQFSINGRLAPFGSPTFSADGQTLIYLDQEASCVNLYHLESQSLRHQLRGHTDAITWAGMSPDNTRVASIVVDGTAQIWDASSGACLHVLGAVGGKLWCGAFSPDGKYLAVSQEKPELCVHVYHMETGKPITTCTELQTSINSLIWSPNGKLLAGEGPTSWLALWDPFTGVDRMPACLRSLYPDVKRMRFAQGGRKLLVQSREGTVVGHDLEIDLKLQLRRARGRIIETGLCSDMVGLGDSRLLVVLDRDGFLRLWDL
ncbi:WD40 repeat-like protein [Aspergillus ibericus CBS 121593]|uniref:WD40 repeat-like protein n=1 Tax=Aspergillus ibericus CBS 121593 TaxID=1448316 RepID=A0A395GJK2_9EURO|nr:WD40 repeat-like protein [Aspergillus ibericus CBS 121593]RAK95544.1 WD40 repeat-like protein [Aspergillus ibericus CBS 121593]